MNNQTEGGMARFCVKWLPLVAALALAGCGGGGGGASPADNPGGNNSATPNEPELPDEQPVTEAPAQARVSFVVIGDSGEGSDGQYAVGKAIADVCNAKGGMAEAMTDSDARPGCDLVVGLGDNIYEAGVTSVDDPQFAEKFETPFEPVKLPFYMVLGNHDNTGYVGGDGAGNARGEFQVDYTFFDGRLSNRWHMPDRYYKQSEGQTADGRPLVDFFGLDSNPIAGGFADPDLTYSYHTYGLAERNWAVNALAGSDAVFKIGMAHHPYLSNGDHGNAGNYDGVPSAILPVLAGSRWKAFMEEAVCDKTDFFLAGHDHDMQVLDAVPSCGRTEFVVSGAASKSRSLKDPERNAALFQQGDTYGFFWMQAREADMATQTPARMCLEAYVVDASAEGLGVISQGQLTPAFTHCYDKQPMTGMMAGNDFSGEPMDGSGIPTALPLPDGFDAAFTGPLQQFREALIAGFNQASTSLPEGPQQQVFAQLVTATDTLFNALDAATAAILSGDDSDITQSFQAVLAASQQLDAIDTASLPAPFDQLGGAFEALAQGFGNGNTEAGGSTVDDVAFIAGPLVELSRNLNNILDGIEEQVPAEVPVFAGLTSVLSTVSLGLANTLEQVVLLDTSATGEELVGTVQATLENVVNDVLWLNRIPGAEDYTTLPGDALSSVLLTVVREVTEQLDERLLSPLAPLLNLLSPLTNLLKGLLGNL
ncbi:metallophosphoesterase-like protein [Alcanivorax hongdengensis A-11-3]|uniref:Metallophosphoesterase-like protein n=1 Tax=Alcanivorax hongdengensis A-11-3 TaxID=1177179 RepID=L0WGE0_9GAMM|nr:metallophosphoesterase [Alcanivorax hongdengensis]EKF76086.1 metallophosphoesterase-like protein [Alcanivorax hongdengensis A-11-3]